MIIRVPAVHWLCLGLLISVGAAACASEATSRPSGGPPSVAPATMPGTSFSLPSAPASTLSAGATFEPYAGILGIPAQLHGRWEANLEAHAPLVPGGTYSVDFRSAVLLTGPDGTMLRELGGAANVTPDEGASDTFLARLAGPCGVGFYSIERRPVDRLTFTPIADPCTERAAILTASTWVFGSPLLGPALGPFTPGGTYDSGPFTEPFWFAMPAVDDSGVNQGLRDQFRYAYRYVSDGGLRFGGSWWGMEILDDLPVNVDLCDEASALRPDVPDTPEGVVEWFRTSGLAVSELVLVPVDGRTAGRFDIEESGPSCNVGRFPPGGHFAYMGRVYAIPTGDDTIVLAVGSDGVNWEAVKAAIEAFVRSMDFD